MKNLNTQRTASEEEKSWYPDTNFRKGKILSLRHQLWKRKNLNTQRTTLGQEKS
jgi:hypothetical protein